MIILETNHSNDYIINLYPTLKCNLKCSYCYSNNTNSKDFEFTKDEFESILNKINSIKNNVFLNILGGEPTLYKHLSLLNNLNKNIIINITTNGQNPSVFKRLITDNIELEISLHHEYYLKSNKYFENIFKILQYRFKKITLIINISYDSIKYLNYIKNSFFDYRDKIFITLNKITGVVKNEKINVSNYISIFRDFKFDENNTKYFINKKEVDYYKFLKVYEHINFKNCDCYMNIFDVKKNKKIKIFNSCTQKELNDFKITKNICKNETCIFNCFSDTKKILKKT